MIQIRINGIENNQLFIDELTVAGEKHIMTPEETAQYFAEKPIMGL
jgi:hypothetical protein